MCGKDSASTTSIASTPGSPPHVRERLVMPNGEVKEGRITPACAGKTVMDPFIFATSRLSIFKIYLISLQDI